MSLPNDNLGKTGRRIITYYFIKNEVFEDTLKLAKILLNHEHDLIHKAVGWMLLKVGNRNLDLELNF